MPGQPMSPEELCYMTADALRAGYSKGTFSPLEICEVLLARMSALNDTVNAYVLLGGEELREAAKASSARWRDASPLGPLDGIPVAVKDVLPVRGWPTRHGSPACAGASAESRDAVAVTRLREAGALIAGKTRTWEFAWHGRVDRPPEEVVRNPWALEHSTLGSSSGSAAAVASGQGVAALGTDSGGSVRGPASACGIVGIKPTQARVPVYPPSPMMEMEHIGVLARTVRDAALVLGIVAGYHSLDPDSWPFAEENFEDGLETGIEGLTIGISSTFGCTELHPDVEDVFDEVVANLGQLGVNTTILDIELGDVYENTTTIYTPMAMASLDEVPTGKESLADPLVLELNADSTQLSSKDYFRALQQRLAIRRLFTHAFDNVDLMLTPTLETVPNRLTEPSPDMLLNRIFDLTGQPSVSVPVGSSETGLPIGVQIVANKGQDALALRAAHALEKLYPPRRPPEP